MLRTPHCVPKLRRKSIAKVDNLPNLARDPEFAIDRVWRCRLRDHLYYYLNINVDASCVCSGHRPQYFTSVGYQLQPQTCTPFTPHPHHTTRPRRLTPTAKSRQRRVWFQHHVNSSITFCRFSRKRHARTRSVADSGNCTRLVL